MSSDNVLIIFIKYPQAGFVKTRLAKEIGKKNASELYRLFVETILSQVKDKNFTRVIFYSPVSKRNEIKRWLGENPALARKGGVNLVLYPQKGRDLGERLSDAFRLVFRKGAKRVVVIGTDSPTLDKKIVLDAFERLNNVQCVLGPALDGGYYLVGLSYFYREIFKGINWSSVKVFNQTLAIIKRLRIQFSLLKENFDIDNLCDLMSFRRRLPQIHKTNSADLTYLIEALDKVLKDQKYVKHMHKQRNYINLSNLKRRRYRLCKNGYSGSRHNSAKLAGARFATPKTYRSSRAKLRAISSSRRRDFT